MLKPAEKKALDNFFTKNRRIRKEREMAWKQEQLLAEIESNRIDIPFEDKTQENVVQYCENVILQSDSFLDPEYIETVPCEPICYRGKLKIRDLTDHDMFEIEQQQSELNKIARDEAWEQYKEMFFDERPHNQADEKLKKIQTSIEEEKKKLEAAKKKPKKYVAPSARKVQTTDPEIKTIEDSIETLENEFKEANKLIVQLNAQWEQEQRRIFEKDFFKVSLL